MFLSLCYVGCEHIDIATEAHSKEHTFKQASHSFSSSYFRSISTMHLTVVDLGEVGLPAHVHAFRVLAPGLVHRVHIRRRRTRQHRAVELRTNTSAGRRWCSSSCWLWRRGLRRSSGGWRCRFRCCWGCRWSRRRCCCRCRSCRTFSGRSIQLKEGRTHRDDVV